MFRISEEKPLYIYIPTPFCPSIKSIFIKNGSILNLNLNGILMLFYKNITHKHIYIFFISYEIYILRMLNLTVVKRAVNITSFNIIECALK